MSVAEAAERVAAFLAARRVTRPIAYAGEYTLTAADLQTLVEQVRNTTFRCPSFVYAGPGHQSRHECEIPHPHPIEGEHSNPLYEWEGTSVEEHVGPNDRRLISNAKHRGDGRCGH